MSQSFVSDDFYFELEEKIKSYTKEYHHIIGLAEKYKPITSIEIELMQQEFIRKLSNIVNYQINPIYITSGLYKNETNGFILSTIETISSLDKNSTIVEE